MPEEKVTIDPKTELPSPHDMLLEPNDTSSKAKKPVKLPTMSARLLILFAILLLPIFVAFPLLVGQQAHHIKTNPATNPMTISVTPIPTEAQLTQSRIYTNTINKYSVMYPPDWEYTETTNSVRFSGFFPTFGPHAGHAITIKTIENRTKLSLSGWIESNVILAAKNRYKEMGVGGADQILRETRSFNGKQFILVSGAHLPSANDSTHAYISKGSTIIDISLDGYSLDQKDNSFTTLGKAAFFGMLNSLTFIEPTLTENRFCGGIANIRCPQGYSCKLDGTYPDAGGTCVSTGVEKPNPPVAIPTTAASGRTYPAPILLAINNLSKQTGVPTNEITVVTFSDEEWSDSSLGCGQPDMMYLQVITPGYKVTLSDGKRNYVYHTDMNNKAIQCSR